MASGGRFSLIGAWVFLLYVLSNPVASAQTSLVVRWTEERLTVSANNVPLAQVLREVARQTGVQLVGAERLTESSSIEFAGKSLADGVKLLLARVDYLMAWRDPLGPPVTRVWVFRPGESGAVRPEPATSPPQSSSNQADSLPSEDPTLERAEEAIAAVSELPEESRDPDLQRLEDSGFFETASESALLVATNQESLAVRVKAFEVLSQRNPSLSADVLGTAFVDANPAVSNAAAVLMAENGDARAVENLGKILKNDDPVVRFRAIQLLAQRDDPDSLPYVRQVLNDGNPAVRLIAQELMERLEVTRSRP